MFFGSPSAKALWKSSQGLHVTSGWTKAYTSAPNPYFRARGYLPVWGDYRKVWRCQTETNLWRTTRSFGVLWADASCRPGERKQTSFFWSYRRVNGVVQVHSWLWKRLCFTIEIQMNNYNNTTTYYNNVHFSLYIVLYFSFYNCDVLIFLFIFKY